MPDQKERAEMARQAAKLDQEKFKAQLEAAGLPVVGEMIGDTSVPLIKDQKNQFVKQLENLAQQAPPGGLPDDYDQVMGLVPQEGEAPPKAPEAKQVVRSDHPVLQKLRRDLGLMAGITQMPELAVGNATWGFVPLDDWGYTFALALSSTVSDTPLEGSNNFRAAILATACRTIDKVPVHKVFNVEIPVDIEYKINNDPSRIPPLVRRLVAPKIFEFLLFESKGDLPDKLYEAYLEAFKNSEKVESYLDKDRYDRVTFKCPKCDYSIREKPRFAGDKELPFYCKFHGTIMEAEAALPLS